jgi:hypothetical protein
MPQSIQLSVSDYAEISALFNRFREVPGARVSRTPGQPEPGEQGVLDWITALGGSSVLVAVVGTIPAYLRARRSGISVKMKVKGKDFTVTVENVDDVMPIIERLILDD